MEALIGGVSVHYAEHGEGATLVALHGAGVDHRDVESALEAVAPAGWRRIYPDLPGMGATTGDGLAGNDDVVGLLIGFLDRLGAAPVMLLGHSYGAYLARGVAARRPDLLRGLALLCPLAERSGPVPDHTVLRQDPDAYDVLGPEHRPGFDEYFVVRTRQTAQRYRESVAPGIALADHGVLGRIAGNWHLDLDAGGFDGPVLILAGRHDSVVGDAEAVALLRVYPRATLTVVEDAGHALMHEQPQLLAATVGDWLARGSV